MRLNKSGIGGQSPSFIGNDGQGRFRDGGWKSQSKSKQQEPKHIPLLSELVRDSFSQRKQGIFKAHDKEKQAQDDQSNSVDGLLQMGEGFLNDEGLENKNNAKKR